jgi:predicted O-methyltransferase YrrM
MGLVSPFSPQFTKKGVFMRNIGHLNANYVLNRLAEIAYQGLHPELPWLNRNGIEVLGTVLKGDDVGLELGSGRSTTWLAKRVRRLVSVEHNRDWFERVNENIKKSGLMNIEYELRDEEEYVYVFDRLDECSLDFVFVDGIKRAECANYAIQKIKPGGILIIDNVNWYLPSESKSPNSRTMTQGPISDWMKVYEVIKHWRYAWTTNGVSDTGFFFKGS